jgi:hypothetical protein
MKPAKEANPNCKVIIKYPNWAESYQESGYNPIVQKDIFDSYTPELRQGHRTYRPAPAEILKLQPC